MKRIKTLLKRICVSLLEFETNSISQYLLLALITLIAVALRFYKLEVWSFWGDEMITVNRAQKLFQEGIALKPISLMLTYASLTMLGTSEWSARLVPALIGIVSVPALYFPIRKMFGPTVALMAGLLLAISPWHLYWSQNARFYSALLLFCSLALLTFYFGIEEDRPWYLVLSLFFLGLAALERLTALLFMPVIVSYLVLVKILPFEKPAGLRWRNLCLFFLPGLLPGLFLAWPYLQQPSQWWATFSWVNNNPFWILAGVIYYIGLPTICIGGLGMLYLLIKKDRATLLLSLGALIPLSAIVIVSMFQYSANRYVFISLTSWIILASVAAKELFWQTQKSAKILALSALLILLLAPLAENVLYYKYQNGNRDNWKGAFALVKQQKKAGDLVVVSDVLIGNYYLKEETIGIWELEFEDLDQLIAKGNRIWFVADMNVEVKKPRMQDWLVENTQLVANMDVHVQARNFKMRIYLLELDDLSDSQVAR